jgi:transcriptional regulator with XRE-family HTH domain
VSAAAGLSTVGHRLRTLRTGRDLTQDAVAQAVGVTRAYLSGLETGADMPGRDLVDKLARYYGISLDWLLNGTQAENETELLLQAFRDLSGEDRQLLLRVAQRLAARE